MQTTLKWTYRWVTTQEFYMMGCYIKDLAMGVGRCMEMGTHSWQYSICIPWMNIWYQDRLQSLYESSAIDEKVHCD